MVSRRYHPADPSCTRWLPGVTTITPYHASRQTANAMSWTATATAAVDGDSHAGTAERRRANELARAKKMRDTLDELFEMLRVSTVAVPRRCARRGVFRGCAIFGQEFPRRRGAPPCVCRWRDTGLGQTGDPFLKPPLHTSET